MALDGRVLMSRVFSTASRLVTSNDEFVNSLEGIECIMIESMYLNNAGELRRAWMTNRRAMTIAQMLGLNTSSNSASTILEADTRARIDPDYMWFRLVCNDRYLSLMLGLPQGSIDSAFAAPEALQGCTALERMERLMTAAGGLILQRGSTFERADVTTTYKIDKMIQEAAALMSPQWWAANPGSGAVANNDIKAYEETIRLTNQFAYYHLLVQLHLPYMMQNSSMNSNYDYSTLTAASASRAIVTQFVSFRQSITGTAYCRGMDFVAFIASTALCLAHVESRRPRQFDSEKTVRTGLRCLYHQRLRDRGLLERILEIMETAVQVSNDAVAEKISGILRPLLVVEDNSAKGTTYDASASPEVGKQAHHRSGNTDEAFKVLKIEIPYFGTVTIDHRHITHENVGTLPTFTHEQLGHTHASERSDPGFTLLHEPNPPRTSHRYGQYYTINATNSGNTDCQDDAFTLNQPPTDRLQQSELTLSADNDCLLLDTDSALLQDDCLFLPTATTGTDDWALQGVDMALFTTLTQNSGD
ncbi:hypothetical protein TruAng_003782 [Truncatella angustata]|nr:hypothetical protein TruAng_003782 [Truncatella angustata]